MSIRLERDRALTSPERDAAMRRFARGPRPSADASGGREHGRATRGTGARCSDGSGGRPARARPRDTLIVALKPAGYGLLVKLAGRYAWHEGTRDDVLATVRTA